MKLAVIGNVSLVRGFLLAGVHKARVAHTIDEAEDALKQYFHDPEIGIIILLDRFAEDLKSLLIMMRKERRVYPVIIVVSGDGTGKKAVPLFEDELMKMVGIQMVGAG
ncbi:MAG TPA: V-type ATP synthase subunit F [Methanoregulaceae archaeon]|nr:V-type ATP synthase subunit F [Methanoregulaceae archaeon]